MRIEEKKSKFKYWKWKKYEVGFFLYYRKYYKEKIYFIVKILLN